MIAAVASPDPAAALYGAGVRAPELFIPFADGGRWDLLAPDPAALCWRDLATRLARSPRFTGGAAWSLAEHMLLVASLCRRPETKPYALLHDAHEGLIGDWVTPVKGAIAALGGGGALAELERLTAEAVHASAGLSFPPPAAVLDDLARADLAALATERRDLLTAAQCAGWGQGLPDPAPLKNGRLKPRGPEAVAQAWLDALVRVAGLAPERAR